jgi:hypothetical protein
MIESKIGEQLPETYVLLVGSGLSLKPWRVLTSQEESDGIRDQRKIELPLSPDCIPFARRQDNDDIAALEIDYEAPPGGKIKGVIVDHLSWTTGQDPLAKSNIQLGEDNITFSSQTIIDWLRNTVIKDVIEWEEDPSQIQKFIEING